MEKPEVGTKGFYAIGTDVYPITVTKVSKTGKKVSIRFEKFVGDKENGHDYYGTQKWIFSEDLNGRVESACWNPSTKKYRIGGSGTVCFGKWYAKQDPSF